MRQIVKQPLVSRSSIAIPIPTPSQLNTELICYSEDESGKMIKSSLVLPRNAHSLEVWSGVNSEGRSTIVLTFRPFQFRLAESIRLKLCRLVALSLNNRAVP